MQVVPLATDVCWQPRTGSQESVVQTFLWWHVSGEPAVQLPFWQVSVPLQTLASPHAVPFSAAMCVQPKTGSQASVVQALPSSQLSVVPPVHVPFWQVSAPLQTVPSAQAVPLPTLTCWQPSTGSQLSVVHVLPSLQLSAVPATQGPPGQA